uniref:Transmembrane protein n=1 Tax=Kalanchoe fedtschenkoi TaxID=63787 RepID=A0A7N0RD40_KALFE
MAASCPADSFTYNGTQCACRPGHLLLNESCTLFQPGEQWVVQSGVDYGINFPETLQRFESIKRFTQSQAVFLEAAGVLLLLWLGFCLVVRLQKLNDGRSVWFRIRWWLSRLDICFATRHWLEDQKAVVKRKTELGGTLSVASLVFFIGLFAALLYEIISKRSVEVHNVRATNAPDLTSFKNDLEFNITAVSSMSCSNLRGLETLVTGTPGFIDQRVVPLSTIVNYSCHNGSIGPTISLRCDSCPLLHDIMYTSWWFVDLPNSPAAAVGFKFNLSAQNRERKKHVSLVSGTLTNGSGSDTRPVTYRGLNTNILKFNLFPRVYRNFRDLKLVQPLFHEFVPGSLFGDTGELQASLQRPDDGLINTTLYLNFLSAYLLEIRSENVFSPVNFFADVGGLCCVSFGIFLYILIQCEYRIKRLRNEDSNLRKIRSRLRAQRHWDKLRKYVMYTWDCRVLEDMPEKNSELTGCCTDVIMRPLQGTGSSRRQSSLNGEDASRLNRKSRIPRKKHQEELNEESKRQADSNERDASASGTQSVSIADYDNPLPIPILELEVGSGTDMAEIRKSIQSLCDYNNVLRENLVVAQSELRRLVSKSHSSSEQTHPQAQIAH